MKKSKFVKELERIIDMVKTGDDGFEYGGKVIFYKEDDDNHEILVKNIEMNLMVEPILWLVWMIGLSPALWVRSINKSLQRL